MKPTRDLAVILGTALLTAILAGPVLGPALLTAQDAEAVEVVEVVEVDFEEFMFPVPESKPIEVDGFRYSVEFDKERYLVGENPEITLVVASLKKEKGQAGVTLQLESNRPQDMFSRSISMPEQMLTKKYEVELQAGETKRFDVALDKPIESEAIVNALLNFGERVEYTSGFAMKSPPVVEATDTEALAAELTSPAVEKLTVFTNVSYTYQQNN